MKAKDKAKELVDKYFYLFSVELENTIDYREAKQCALVAVDVILNDIMLWWYAPTGDMPKDMVYFITQKNYWIEVKQEIEKL